MRYRSEIDGLRALAVVPVVFFHAGFAAFSGGFVGVDIFFVISGYLITTIILLESSDFSFVRFYERRFRRIVPALFVVVLACIIPAWLLLPPIAMRQFAHSVMAVVVFSSNILFWNESGYFEPSAELKPLLHTWSLAVEEQFYLFFPIFLLSIVRFSRRWLLCWFVVAGLASFALAQWGSTHEPTAAFYLIPTRGWELLAGATIAGYLFRQSGASSVGSTKPVAQVASAIGLLLIIVSIVAFGRSTPFPGIYAAVPVLGAALIILFASPDNVVGRLLGWKPLVAIGLVSYSAYLWHQPLFAFARSASLDEPSFAVYLVLCAATGIAAFLSWRFVERPFRDRSKVSRQGIFAMTLAGSFIFAAFGLAGHFTDGFRTERLTKAQIRTFATVQNSPEASKCHASDSNALAPEDACRFFAQDVRWAVLGDSHGVTLSHALAKELEPAGIGLKQLTFSGCFPTYGRAELTTPCALWTERAVADLLADRHITTVVVAYRLDLIAFGGDAKPYPAIPDEADVPERNHRLDSYFGLIAALGGAGKRVIVFDQVPLLRKHVSDLIYQFGRDGDDIVGVRRSQWKERNAFMSRRLHALAAPVSVFEPGDFLCRDDVCPAVVDGTSRYFDDNHLSILGARFIAKEILAADSTRAAPE